MDRYLYKAKRINNGEWVTGSLLTCEDGTCKIATSLLEVKTNGPILVCAYDVDRDTICQCTGLKDKDSKLVWENDIMVAHLDKTYPDDKTYQKVIWEESGFYSKVKGSEDIEPIDRFDQEWFEVIGNIFDNPELLESEEK